MARPFCDDWSCPALASCARHFGRSLAYWEMAAEEPTDFFKGKRKRGKDSCVDYERDKLRQWMVAAHAALEPTTSGSWRMPLFVQIEGRA